MLDSFRCNTCKCRKPASDFPPAKTRLGIKKTCTKCDIEREQRKDARRLAVRRAKAAREKETRRVELAQVIEENRRPEMFSIVPAGSEWAQWWQELVDADAKA